MVCPGSSAVGLLEHGLPIYVVASLTGVGIQRSCGKEEFPAPIISLPIAVESLNRVYSSLRRGNDLREEKAVPEEREP